MEQILKYGTNYPAPNVCPACLERAQGHQRTLQMIHAGAERARMEANGQTKH